MKQSLGRWDGFISSEISFPFMYLTDIVLRNVGPIEALALTPRFRADGSPIPLVLVGPNGAGKSLTISLLVDAIVEAKKHAWTTMPEVAPNQYLKIMSKSYVRTGSDYSLSQVKFKIDGGSFVCNELASRLEPNAFREKYPELQIDGRPIPSTFDEAGFLKEVLPTGDIKQAAKQNILLYFPYFRYERPAWLNADSGTSLGLRDKLAGITKESVFQVDVVERISTWLLDVVLDREIYEKQLVKAQIPGFSNAVVDVFTGYEGPNAHSVTLIQEVLLAMYSMRDGTITGARIGINRKTTRQVCMFVSRGAAEELVAGSVAQMSSGELMILSLCASIIRAYDLQNAQPAAALSDIKGVVLIDEIDLHLHVVLQKEVLPKLIGMFPGVQFVLTTHSPFFMLGMEDKGDDAVDIISMPIGAKIATEDFSEFRAAYDLFVEKNQQFKSGYEAISGQLAKTTRPLIVTEGKTDWKHMKSALSRLQASGRYTNVDIDLLEYEDDIDMGDRNLEQMCRHFSNAPHSRRTIFVFDRDNKKIIEDMAGDPNDGYKRWSEQVFSFCIPVPGHRGNHSNVSIEFYYTDDDLRTIDPGTGKRLFFTNEVEIVRRPGKGPEEIRVLAQPKTSEESDKRIFDEDCRRIRDTGGNQAGHSKAVFAANVLSGSAGFDSFNISEFGRIFDAIVAILQVQ